LPIAPSTYYAHKSLEREPDRACDRSKRGQWLEVEIQRVWDENQQVYGVRKIWRQLARENIEAARCTVARLMKRLGIEGVSKTTIRCALPADSFVLPPYFSCFMLAFYLSIKIAAPSDNS
jgi:hypothetical protein